MAELEDVTLDGKPLHSLRVADLKSALEERGLSKSGQKNALIKRLKGALMLENLQRTSSPHTGFQPNSQIGEEMSQNSFIKQYLAKQQELLRQRLEREAREAAEADDSTAAPDDEDHAEGSDITSCAPDPQCSVPPHPLPPPPGGTKEMMSAESCVAEPGPQEAPQPPRAVASLSVRVLPPPGPARSSLPLSQSAHDEDGEEEQGAALRRSGRGQPTWERSRRKQQPPQHIPPRQPTPPPSPPLEPEPSFLLPDTPKQSPPVPASAPPMQAGGPAPLPGSPPEPEGGVEQGPPMPATLQEQPQTSTQPTESVPDTSPSALAPTPQVPPPKGGSAPCAATERAAAGAERVTLQGRGACVVPVLPPSPPPEDGDPNRAGARLSSSSPSSPSSLSSSTQEKLRPAHQGNAGLSPPYRRTGVVLEEGAASQKKKAGPEKDVGEEERTHKPREVMEVEGPAEGAVRCLEKNTSTSVCAPKISLNTPPSGGLGEVESVAAAGRKRRWGFSTATTTKKKLSISITTDSLKSLMPGMKPTAGPGSQDAVVELHPEESCLSGEEDGPEPGQAGDPPIRRTVTQVVPAEKQENGQKEREEEEEEEEERGGLPMEEQHDGSPEVAMETDAPPTPEVDTKKVSPSTLLVRRSISQQKSGMSVTIDDPIRITRQPSPPHGKTTNIVHVRNLVRPFTLVQLKELLNRTGTVVEEGFWIDKIKSHCYVTYSSTEEAVATRVALHGVRWPQSNPKFLSVEFCEQEELDFHRGVLVSGQGTEEDAGSCVGLGPPPSLLPARERDRARDRERERDREKDRDRNRERERERDGDRERERDRGERDQWAQREWEMRRRERTRAEREWDRDKVKPGEEREWDRDKVKPGEERGAGARRSPSHDRERRHKERKNDKKEEAPAKLLDDLFYKTKTSPCIYWLHLTEQQALQRDAERAERMKERERRRKEEEEAQRGGVLARDRETAGGVSRGTEAEWERGKEREKEREKGKERERERGKERDRGQAREGERERGREREREGDKRRDGYRGKGAESRRSRSHSNPPPRDRRH